MATLPHPTSVLLAHSPRGVGGGGGRGKQFAAAVFFYIIFCYFAMRSKCGFYVFVYGKIREMAFTPLSLSFSRSRPVLKVPKVTIMKFTHHLPRQGCLSASSLAASPNFFLGLSINFLATPN